MAVERFEVGMTTRGDCEGGVWALLCCITKNKTAIQHPNLQVLEASFKRDWKNRINSSQLTQTPKKPMRGRHYAISIVLVQEHFPLDHAGDVPLLDK